jgi:hypothetical protein
MVDLLLYQEYLGDNTCFSKQKILEVNISFMYNYYQHITEAGINVRRKTNITEIKTHHVYFKFIEVYEDVIYFLRISKTVHVRLISMKMHT